MIVESSSPADSVRTFIKVDHPPSFSLALSLAIYQEQSVVCTPVTFHEIRNEYYNNVQMDRDEVQGLWYSIYDDI